MNFFGNYYRIEFSKIYRQLQMISMEQNEENCTVIFQSYPNEFPQTFVDRLIQANPLATVLLIAGTACEGECRTGNPLKGCFRIYAAQWNDFHRNQLSRYLNNVPSLFSLPRTAENDELILFLAAFEKSAKNTISTDISQNKDCAIVWHQEVLGNDSAMNQFLTELYQYRGYQVFPLEQNLPNSFNGTILADIDDSPFTEILQSVQRLRQNFADAKIAVCINSPRINEKIDLQNAGVNEIFDKLALWQN